MGRYAILNVLQIKNPKFNKSCNLSLDDMVGRYQAIEPINCVELKQKMK